MFICFDIRPRYLLWVKNFIFPISMIPDLGNLSFPYLGLIFLIFNFSLIYKLISILV